MEDKNSNGGFLKNFLNTGELGTVNVAVENSTIVKLVCGIIIAGSFIVLIWAFAKK